MIPNFGLGCFLSLSLMLKAFCHWVEKTSDLLKAHQGRKEENHQDIYTVVSEALAVEGNYGIATAIHLSVGEINFASWSLHGEMSNNYLFYDPPSVTRVAPTVWLHYRWNMLLYSQSPQDKILWCEHSSLRFPDMLGWWRTGREGG